MITAEVGSRVLATACDSGPYFQEATVLAKAEGETCTNNKRFLYLLEFQPWRRFRRKGLRKWVTDNDLHAVLSGHTGRG